MLHQYIHLVCVYCGHEVDVPVYCGNRFCPVCGVSRRGRVRSRLEFIIKNLNLRHNEGIKFLTLTIPNQSNVSLMVKDLIASFRRLRQRSFWKNHCSGGAYVLEITGRPGNWHAHIHATIQATFMKWDLLLKEWQMCSGGRGVYIKKLPVRDVIQYLTKYLTKSGSPEHLDLEVSELLKGYRLFSPFGSWHSINRLWVNERRSCPKCNSQGYLPFDIFLGRPFSSFEKESSSPVVREEDSVRCKLTSDMPLSVN